MAFKNLIRAVVIDIDGCLTSKTFGEPLDIDSLHEIQKISQQYNKNPTAPQIVLNTGRDGNHTELMAKILDAFHYFIIESGASIISIHGAELKHHLCKSLTPEQLEAMHRFQSSFLKKNPRYRKYLQYGKRYMITFLFENDDPILKECSAALRLFLEKGEYDFNVDDGHNFINVVFPEINKGSGLDLLFQIEPDLHPGNVAGIGDSEGDWDFLEACAFSACPANASEALKSRCDYVARGQEAKGTLEILRYIVTRNRYSLEKQKARRRQPEVIIKGIICDVNGTIDSAVYGEPLDFEGIKKIRAIIQSRAKDPAVPRIFLNTGWELSYTMLYSQLLNDMESHVIERGAAIVSIDGPFVRVKTDPRITNEMIGEINELQAGFLREHPDYHRYFQAGKKYTISFQFQMGSIEMEECLADFKAYLKEHELHYEIDVGPNYFNVGVPGIDKGTGAELLLGMHSDLEFEDMLGIGDSTGDWKYMSKCGYKACPSNANAFLKERCDYVASKPDTEGFLEILERVIQWNLDHEGNS